MPDLNGRALGSIAVDMLTDDDYAGIISITKTDETDMMAVTTAERVGGNVIVSDTGAPQTVEGQMAHLVEIAQAVAGDMATTSCLEMADLAQLYFEDAELVVAVAALGAEHARRS